MDLFIGRLHPLLVHLPIGFMLIAVILELLGVIQRRSTSYEQAVLISLLAGILAGLVAIISGWLLADGGVYGDDQLIPHKVSGIVTVVLAGITYLVKRKVKNYKPLFSWLGTAVLTIQVSIAGHLGGVLTHGEGYLFEYAPSFLQRLAGETSDENTDISLMEPDSVLIYRDMIQPLFREKCISCHHWNKTSGGLNLKQYAGLFKKGETAMPITPGNVEASEIFSRISLPPEHKKFMPEKGKGLSYTQIKVLKYWIEQGADSTAQFSADNMGSALITLIRRDYGLDFRSRPYYEKAKVEKLQESKLDELRSNGIIVSYLGEENYLLDVSFTAKKLTEAQIKELETVPTVTFLDLSECDFPTLEFVTGFQHLTRLDLNGSSVTDEDLDHLAGLQYLETVNLYNTEVTIEGIQTVVQLPGLRKVYLWGTALSEEELAALKTTNPEIDFVEKFTFIKPIEKS